MLQILRTTLTTEHRVINKFQNDRIHKSFWFPLYPLTVAYFKLH